MAAFYFGYLNFTPTPDDDDVLPLDLTGTGDVPTTIGHGAAIIKVGLQNAITRTSITSDNNRIDVTRMSPGGVLDFTTRTEPTITVDNASESSTLPYSEGDVLVFHTSSDNDPSGGTDHYDRMYYVQLMDGAPVRRFTANVVVGSEDSEGYWTYRFKSGVAGAKTGLTVIWVAGDTPYWSVGALPLIPRVSAANLDLYLMYGGNTLSYIDDGSSWDTSAGTPTVALEDSSEEFQLKLDAGAADVAYGSPMITVTQKGELQTRVTVAAFSTTMLAIDSSLLADKDWIAINDNTLTTEDAWYYLVPEMIPNQGDSFLRDITIPIDSSGASLTTAYTFKVWLIDMQLEALFAEGTSTTTIYTARGFINQYGLDAMIFARAYQTSGNAGSNQVLTATIYTPAS